MRWYACLCFVSLLPANTLCADPPASTRPDKPRYETRADHDPEGTGKFYLGREIAQVMGHEGADWLDRPERVSEEQPNRLLKALKIKPGSVVADIGAGSGFFTFRLAKLVGPKGKVLAVDIQPEMIAIIRQRMKERKIANVAPIRGTLTDPKLPTSGVDLILMVDVYHEFSHPWEMTRAMIRSLRPGGRMVFVEYRLEDPKVPIKLVHKMTEKQVRKEMAVQPELRHVQTLEILPWQHIIIFEKKRPGSENRNGQFESGASRARLLGGSDRPGAVYGWLQRGRTTIGAWWSLRAASTVASSSSTLIGLRK